ncbi:MAG TPA: competence type IV pilus major pilin ComGC [Virgibacillus sp.]|nr:competence type IV pilus major pilin ComGC [Virgibacillus sp.]
MFKKESGFTLIEMLIVLTIISLLIILIIPNVSSKNDSINEKGCEALVEVVQTQAGAYYLDNGEYPSMSDLESSNYITEGQTKCKNGQSINIDGNGNVTAE